MPKNKGKGGKNRKRGINKNDDKRELVFKEDGQEYAQVLKMLGNVRLDAYCFDGVIRKCHIRGKMRKRVWINTGDIILIGLRDYQDAKADVILKYSPDEARDLKNYKELPDNAKINEGNPGDNEDEDYDVEFGDMSDEEEGPAHQSRQLDLPSNDDSDSDSSSDNAHTIKSTKTDGSELFGPVSSC